MKYKLSEISNYVTDKVDVEAISISQYISTENMLEGKKGIKTIEKMPNVKRVTAFKKKDILISNIRPYFKKIWFAEFDGGCSSDVLVFRSKDIVTSEFLFTLLLQDTFFHQMVLSSKGTKMPRGDKKAIMNLEFYIPNISIQNKISQIIFNIKEKIELNNQMIDTLEEIASTLFKRWFVDFEFPDENGNPYKSSGGKMIDSELGEIPEGWEIKQLGEIGVINKGLSYKSKFLDQENKNNKSIPFFSLSNFDVNGQIKFDKMKYYFGEYKDKDIVTENDLLIAMTDLTQKRLLLGSCILVPKLGDDMIFSLDIAKYTTDYFLKNYIYNFLKLPKYKLQIENYATGTTVTRISMKDINTIKVVLPESLVLESFNDIVNHHYKLIEELRTNKFLTEQLRDTILPKLLSGEIEV